MNRERSNEVLAISSYEQEARLLSSFILEYNDESQYMAKEDRTSVITFGDGQGNRHSIPFPEGEKDLWKQMRRFRNLIVHGIVSFKEDGSIAIFPSKVWEANRRDSGIQPFPNGLGRRTGQAFEYSLVDLRGLAGLFRGMSIRNRLQASLRAHWVCPSCGSNSPDLIGLERGSVIEFPCGYRTLYQTDNQVLTPRGLQKPGNAD